MRWVFCIYHCVLVFIQIIQLYILFVCNWGSPIELGRSPEKEAMPSLFDRGYNLTSQEFWSAYFGQEHATYTAHTHQQITQLLAKSTVSNCPNHLAIP